MADDDDDDENDDDDQPDARSLSVLLHMRIVNSKLKLLHRRAAGGKQCLARSLPKQHRPLQPTGQSPLFGPTATPAPSTPHSTATQPDSLAAEHQH